jgi:hypothetical protein
VEISSSTHKRAAVPVEQRTSVELVNLVKKLRWIGMEAEAEQVQVVLRDVDPAATLLAGPWDTD